MSVHPAALPPEELLKDCDVRRSRRSGPGGQHRNKVETAITLHHRPSGVIAEASERRSQAENQRVAIARLQGALALEVRVVRREVSSLWRERCQEGRIRINHAHRDFPALLAEALDVIYEEQFDFDASAGRLACTMSQLLRLVRSVSAALDRVNRLRGERGLRPLR